MNPHYTENLQAGGRSPAHTHSTCWVRTCLEKPELFDTQWTPHVSKVSPDVDNISYLDEFPPSLGTRFSSKIPSVGISSGIS